MATFEIKNRWTGTVQYACELSAEVAGKIYGLQMGFAVKQALASGSNLSGSDLSGSNLSGSDLSGSDLSGSNLSGSNLSGSNLSGSNLRGSNLSGSNLSGSNLRGSNLTPIRDDVWAVLSSAPGEAAAVRDALANGRVDGSTYSGECACLVGTIANARDCNKNDIDGLSPNASRPAETFFMAICRGDTPETNQASALAYEWVSEWVERMEYAFGKASAP